MGEAGPWAGETTAHTHQPSGVILTPTASGRLCCKLENSSGLADLRGDERGCGQLPWALDSHLIVNEAS